jgi:tRNA 2-thiouridine synthesizing protein A
MQIADSLDLKGVSCPLNFVKVKLALEFLEDGEVLEVILDPGEPAINDPRSLKQEGYKVLELKPENNYYKLYVQKVEP